MTDTQKPELPNQLSINPRSKFYVEEVFEHEIGVKLNGKERFDVEEYNISEGWIKVASPKALDRRGQPLLLKVKGSENTFIIDGHHKFSAYGRLKKNAKCLMITKLHSEKINKEEGVEFIEKVKPENSEYKKQFINRL